MPHTSTFEYPVQRAPHIAARLAIIPIVALRLYLASVWLRFAVMKIDGGWLTSNPLRPLLTTVADGHLPTTVPGYELVARLLVASGFDAVLSIAIPLTELLVGIVLVLGIAPRMTALMAIMLNVNLLLAGVGSVALDGKMIVLQIILVALVTLAPAKPLNKAMFS